MTPTSFWSAARQNPDHLAVVDPEGRETSAGALLASANRLVHGLRALGLERGSVVAVLLKNETAMIELYMAATQAGWYITPINIHLAAPEIAYILEDSGAGAFIVAGSHVELARKAADAVGFPVDRRFVVGEAAGFQPYTSLTEGQPDSTPAERRAGLPMTYTSGTTGRPKGVRRRLADMEPDLIAGSYAMFTYLFGMTPGGDGVHLVVSPLYHTAVLNFATNALHLGHTLVLMDRWTPEGMLEKCERYRVTSSHMVPTQLHRLLALPEAVKRRYDLSSLRNMIHSAAPCPPDVKRRMIEWWGPVLYEYYAAAEGGGTTVGPAEWLEHPGTVGRPWHGAEIRILDDDGQPCAEGQPGTVYIRMGEHTFEYHKDQKKTQGAWKDGFFTVGDAGYLDAQGYLYLCDRKADMIISGGVNIYPAEIEAVLLAHPGVADAAVFGIPDDDWGEQVKAVIEPTRQEGGQEGLREELLSWCREQLATYKIPKTVDFTDALPRDPNGKLYKRKLRDPYWAGRQRAI